MVQSASNPNGVPMSVFDGIRKGVAGDRSQYFKELAVPFFGFNREGAPVSQGAIDSFWLQGMAGSVKSHYECIKQFSEVDYSEDLKKIDKPTLILHGEDDQIVPIETSAGAAVKLVSKAVLRTLPGLSHGMCVVNADLINTEIHEFIKKNS